MDALMNLIDLNQENDHGKTADQTVKKQILKQQLKQKLLK